MSSDSTTLPEQVSSAAKRDLSGLALCSVVMGASILGVGPLFVRATSVGPTAAAFWRVALAWPILWYMTSLDGDRARRQTISRKKRFWLVVIPGLFFAGDLAFWHRSVLYTTVANSTLLTNFAPIIVAFGGWWLYGRGFSKRFIFGMLMALLGTSALMGKSFTIDRQHVFGDFLGLGSAFFYGAYLLAIKESRRCLSTVYVMAWSCLATAVGLLVITLCSGERLMPPTSRDWLLMIGLALTAQVLARSLVTWGMGHLDAAFSSVVLLTQPVVASILGWVIYGETLGMLQGLGALICLSGIYVAKQGSSDEDP